MKKTLALLLAIVMCLSLFSACGKKEEEAPVDTTPEPATKPAEDVAPPPAEEEKGPDPNTPLVVGYSPFNSKFSPFFSETAYDQDVQAMTQLALLTSDRVGSMVTKGIEGETIPYNGTDYTYYGPADLDIIENDDGTVYYDFTLRDDLVFSDGEPLTVDDVIFTMYALCDPTYDGSSTLYAQPIEGLEAYRNGMTTLSKALAAAGRDNADFTLWTEEQQNAFWNAIDTALVPFAQGIVDYCVEGGYNEEGDVAGASANWGFSGTSETVEDFAMEIGEAYAWVFSAMEVEQGLSDSLAEMMDEDVYNNYPTTGVTVGESVDHISGIQKTGANTFRVVMTEIDATAIYQLSLAITPLHYYGDKALYDYDNNSFGFPKGDLSSLRAKTTQPLGAGPYKFIKFENGVVYFEANENYFKGCPKTKYINFLECTADEDKLNGVITGNCDLSDPSFNNDAIDAIMKANGGDLCGNVIETNTVDNLGYGYIGISAKRVNVAGDSASDASKNLRKALATVLAVYRDVAVDSYYGDRASVINYPISNTSWAAPQPTDDGYKLAFSVDAAGNDIYTSSMKAEDKYEAALAASLTFFEAAGYTVADGKITAAPEGAAMEYECWIPADGVGDHPSFMVLTEARDAFAKIGFNLIIKDLSNSSDLWDGLDADEVDMWCAAWGATVDPDMYQIYHSTNVVGLPGSTGSNHYCIQDEELDEMIMDARASTDQSYRKVMYKACLDTIIDWAVEIPVYQRQNAVIFSAERINLDTVTPDITTFYPWLSEVENIMMK